MYSIVKHSNERADEIYNKVLVLYEVYNQVSLCYDACMNMQ